MSPTTSTAPTSTTDSAPTATTIVDPLHDDGWLALATRSGSLFNSPPWLRALQRTYDCGIDGIIVSPEAGGPPLAGVTRSVLDDPLGARVLAAPFCDYADPIGDVATTWPALRAELDAPGLPVRLRVLRSQEPVTDPGFDTAEVAKWHGTSLAMSEEDVLGSMRKKSRYEVRRARKDGVTVRPATRDELRTFFLLHFELRKHKFRLLAQPYALFENVWDEFIADGDGVVLLAHHDDRLLGGAMFLRWTDTVYYKWSATRHEDRALRPNDLLLLAAMEWGRQNGAEHFDFGLSDLDHEGLIAYKKKFASIEHTIHRCDRLPEGGIRRDVAAAGMAFGRLTELLTDPDVPDRITEEAGAALYRFFA